MGEDGPFSSSASFLFPSTPYFPHLLFLTDSIVHLQPSPSCVIQTTYSVADYFADTVQEWHTQLFTIVHLIADPIDTLWSLFYKIDLARRHADWAKKTNNEPLSENGDGLFTFIPEKTQQPPEISSRNDRVVRHDLEVGSSAHRKPILKRIQTGMIRTQSFQDKDQELPEGRNKAIEQYELDVVALIVDAYQEWHYGLKAKSVLEDCLWVNRTFL